MVRGGSQTCLRGPWADVLWELSAFLVLSSKSPQAREYKKKKTKFPIAGRAPKIRQKYRKNTKRTKNDRFRNFFFCFFFRIFGAQPGGGEFVIFRIFSYFRAWGVSEHYSLYQGTRNRNLRVFCALFYTPFALSCACAQSGTTSARLCLTCLASIATIQPCTRPRSQPGHCIRTGKANPVQVKKGSLGVVLRAFLRSRNLPGNWLELAKILGIRLPLAGAKIPKIGKRGFRSQKKPHFLQPQIGRPESKNPHFYRALQGKWGLFWGGWKWGFFDSETLFSRFWGFWPL